MLYNQLPNRNRKELVSNYKGSNVSVPEVSRFFGIVIRMFYDEHNPPHFHAEYSGKKAVFDFNGNIIKGNLSSRTATKLVRE